MLGIHWDSARNRGASVKTSSDAYTGSFARFYALHVLTRENGLESSPFASSKKIESMGERRRRGRGVFSGNGMFIIAHSSFPS